MPVLYDQHWSTSPPGPIAAPEWVTRNLGTRVAEVGAARIVAAFPLYGYRWRRAAETEVISYDDARRLTSMTNTPLARDHASATLHALSPEGWATARCDDFRGMAAGTRGPGSLGPDRPLNDQQVLLVIGGRDE